MSSDVYQKSMSSNAGASGEVVEKTSRSPLRASIFDYTELPVGIVDLWNKWRVRESFDCPYFHPAFVNSVSRVRNDVKVALIYQDEQVVGILPYQFRDTRYAEPVGGAVNDYHAIIKNPNVELVQNEVFKAIGLKRFSFHSWLSPDASMKRHVYEADMAFVADLAEGPENFIKEIAGNSVAIKRHPQKMRKMLRELGPLRLEIDCKDPEVLDWTIRKKREKYHRTGVVDYFGRSWSRALLHDLFETRLPDFSGMLSALYAGDTLVASHFGMRTQTTLHYWFPVYDKQYSKYSPGTELFLQIVRKSEGYNLDRIDFGYGYDYYKTRLTNRQFEVARGCVDFNPLRRIVNKSFDRCVSMIKSSRLKEPVKKAVRKINPNAGQPKI